MTRYIHQQLSEHLARALPDINAGSVVREHWQLCEALAHAERVFCRATGGQVIAHAEVTANAQASHRASVSAAVERLYWGHGVGREVLSGALKWCDDMGFEYVDGWAWAHNARALALDCKLGFEIVATIKDAYRPRPNESYDQVLLVRKRGA